MPSPLFPNHNRRQREAFQQFRATKFGQQVERMSRVGGNVRSLIGSATRSVEQAAIQYAKSRGLNELFKRLGPVGQIIQSLLRPHGKPIGNVQQELLAAQELLEAFNYTVTKPGEQLKPIAPPPRGPDQPVGSPDASEEPEGEIPELRGGPLVEGMIPVTSSNVHSIGYEYAEDPRQNGNLLVRFLGGTGRQRSGPGSLYRYRDVPREVFVRFKMTASKGKFVWDELRVRGSISGHQYDYELAGTDANGYIPRQAGLKRGKLGEWYLKRSFKGRRSQLPEQQARGPRGSLKGWDDVHQLKLRAGRRTK